MEKLLVIASALALAIITVVFEIGPAKLSANHNQTLLRD
jgi:hypothetical protein